MERQLPQVFKELLNKSEQNAEQQRFEHHFEALALDNSNTLDNESIDTDLRAGS
jgi:hypothetical protein